ncbi:hypothetical protein UY3_06478 [Chelonia mydas]|uniref:Uncharacterized protein n=1 Tax=Chelonia mydas TaxID=8469 RepID=M7BEL0_CHEMY|nr:hypothetical protein UY3_06478 [Chelonia mydas]
MEPAQLTAAVVSIVNTLRIILKYVQNLAKRRQHEDNCVSLLNPYASILFPWNSYPPFDPFNQLSHSDPLAKLWAQKQAPTSHSNSLDTET